MSGGISRTASVMNRLGRTSRGAEAGKKIVKGAKDSSAKPTTLTPTAKFTPPSTPPSPNGPLSRLSGYQGTGMRAASPRVAQQGTSFAADRQARQAQPSGAKTSISQAVKDAGLRGTTIPRASTTGTPRDSRASQSASAQRGRTAHRADRGGQSRPARDAQGAQRRDSQESQSSVGSRSSTSSRQSTSSQSSVGSRQSSPARAPSPSPLRSSVGSRQSSASRETSPDRASSPEKTRQQSPVVLLRPALKGSTQERAEIVAKKDIPKTKGLIKPEQSERLKSPETTPKAGAKIRFSEEVEVASKRLTVEELQEARAKLEADMQDTKTEIDNAKLALNKFSSLTAAGQSERADAAANDAKEAVDDAVDSAKDLHKKTGSDPALHKQASQLYKEALSLRSQIYQATNGAMPSPDSPSSSKPMAIKRPTITFKTDED